MRSSVALALGAVTAAMIASSCRTAEVGSGQKAGLQSAKFEVEPIPLNRMESMQLTRERLDFFDKYGYQLPDVLVTQTTPPSTAWAVRNLGDPATQQQFLQPGDIGVTYSPLKARSQPGEENAHLKEIAMWGMPHAFLVVPNLQPDGTLLFPDSPNVKYCHVDAPRSMSGCDWGFSHHIFRVAEPTEVDLEKRVVSRSPRPRPPGGPRPWNDAAVSWARKVYEMGDKLEYDAQFATEILSFWGGPKSVRSSITRGDTQVYYCSEYPYVVHSIAHRKNLFEVPFMSTVFADLRDNLGTNLFPDIGPLTEERLKNAILAAYTDGEATAGPPTGVIGKALDRGVRAYSRNTTLAQIEQGVLDRAVGAKISPHFYMKEARKPSNKRIFYVGSMEVPPDTGAGAPPAIATPAAPVGLFPVNPAQVTSPNAPAPGTAAGDLSVPNVPGQDPGDQGRSGSPRR